MLRVLRLVELNLTATGDLEPGHAAPFLVADPGCKLHSSLLESRHRALETIAVEGESIKPGLRRVASDLRRGGVKYQPTVTRVDEWELEFVAEECPKLRPQANRTSREVLES